MIKAIFFDFDGTVSDAKRIAYDSMVRTLDEFGFEFDKKKLEKLLGSRTHLILKGLGLHVGSIEAVRNKFYKHFIRAAVDGGIKPCVSLKPLWELRKNYPLIVVSNSRTSFLKASIRTLKIKGLFKKIYGEEKFPLTPKGVPPAQMASADADKGGKDKMLEKLFRKMGIKASEAMYVGDRFSDVEFAREAGCVAVAINNKCSWSDLKTIKKEKPDYIVRDFRGLKKVVRRLEKAE